MKPLLQSHMQSTLSRITVAEGDVEVVGVEEILEEEVEEVGVISTTPTILIIQTKIHLLQPGQPQNMLTDPHPDRASTTIRMVEKLFIVPTHSPVLGLTFRHIQDQSPSTIDSLANLMRLQIHLTMIL